MGSLNAPRVPVVEKQRVSFRRIGRYTVASSGANPYGANTSNLAAFQEPPAWELSAAQFGTQSTVPSGSFLNLSFVKYAEGINDLTVERTLGNIEPDGTNQREIALREITQNSHWHTGGRVVQGRSSIDSVITRASNSGVY